MKSSQIILNLNGSSDLNKLLVVAFWSESNPVPSDIAASVPGALVPGNPKANHSLMDGHDEFQPFPNWLPTIKTWKFEMPSVIRTWIFLRKKKTVFSWELCTVVTSYENYKRSFSSWRLNHPSKKYARQTGSFPPKMKIKHIWNHHPV